MGHSFRDSETGQVPENFPIEFLSSLHIPTHNDSRMTLAPMADGRSAASTARGNRKLNFRKVTRAAVPRGAEACNATPLLRLCHADHRRGTVRTGGSKVKIEIGQ